MVWVIILHLRSVFCFDFFLVVLTRICTLRFVDWFWFSSTPDNVGCQTESCQHHDKKSINTELEWAQDYGRGVWLISHPLGVTNFWACMSAATHKGDDDSHMVILISRCYLRHPKGVKNVVGRGIYY